MEKRSTYLDFAENDYNFFMYNFDHEVFGTSMAALGQNICERYLKHIISEYAQPCSMEEEMTKKAVLHAHSLKKIMRYMKNEMQIQIPPSVSNAMKIIDGFYFTTRYPGNDSFIAGEEEIADAANAVKLTREFTLDIIKRLEES